MATAQVKGLTKLTAKLYSPMYADFDRQLSAALLRRDAFIDRMIWQELPHLREDLKGKRLSSVANRHISQSLKSLGGKKVDPLRTVSIAIKHETGEALRAVVAEHNLVRDAFLNRLIALLRSSDGLLDALGLPKRVEWGSRNYSDDVPTSPLRAIQWTLDDPLYYLREACRSQYGCGLYMLEFPVEYTALCCYLDDSSVPGTDAHAKRRRSDSLAHSMIDQLKTFEASLTPTKTSGA